MAEKQEVNNLAIGNTAATTQTGIVNNAPPAPDHGPKWGFAGAVVAAIITVIGAIYIAMHPTPPAAANPPPPTPSTAPAP